jgi:hypothetical protein
LNQHALGNSNSLVLSKSQPVRPFGEGIAYLSVFRRPSKVFVVCSKGFGAGTKGFGACAESFVTRSEYFGEYYEVFAEYSTNLLLS